MPGIRERFRPSGPSSRCTAGREKWPKSYAFWRRSTDGETVRMGSVGGGRGTVVKPSPCAGRPAGGSRCKFGTLKTLASHDDPESCVDGREAVGEALTGEHAGGV